MARFDFIHVACGGIALASSISLVLFYVSPHAYAGWLNITMVCVATSSIVIFCVLLMTTTESREGMHESRPDMDDNAPAPPFSAYRMIDSLTSLEENLPISG